MNDYPQITPETIEDIKQLLRIITRERTLDVADFSNLKNVFMSGRKVGKVPTGASDVDPTDKVCDMNYDDAYFYVLTLDGLGAAVWGRMPLDITW